MDKAKQLMLLAADALTPEQELDNLIKNWNDPAARRVFKLKRESQFIAPYLSGNGAAGEGRGKTIGTFMAGKLHGKAKEWSGSYMRALERACERRVAAGTAQRGLSAEGGRAYYPIPDAEMAALRKRLGF